MLNWPTVLIPLVVFWHSKLGRPMDNCTYRQIGKSFRQNTSSAIIKDKKNTMKICRLVEFVIKWKKFLKYYTLAQYLRFIVKIKSNGRWTRTTYTVLGLNSNKQFNALFASLALHPKFYTIKKKKTSVEHFPAKNRKVNSRREWDEIQLNRLNLCLILA